MTAHYEHTHQTPYHEEEYDEHERHPVIRVLHSAIAVMIIGGLIYLSGIYQGLQYQRTPQGIQEGEIKVVLDAEVITVPMNIFVLVNNASLGSQRSEENIRNLVHNATTIWRQANITPEIESITFLPRTDDEIRTLLQNPRHFLSQVRTYDYKRINVFLTRSLNGINGIAFSGLRSMAIADKTTVYDFRAYAHEIGHMLTLRHIPESSGRLMYQGANGTTLSLEEITAARAAAQEFTR